MCSLCLNFCKYSSIDGEFHSNFLKIDWTNFTHLMITTCVLVSFRTKKTLIKINFFLLYINSYYCILNYIYKQCPPVQGKVCQRSIGVILDTKLKFKIRYVFIKSKSMRLLGLILKILNYLTFCTAANSGNYTNKSISTH